MICNSENARASSHSHSHSSSSSSLLRVLCLHDARSNALELSRKLDALGERLYQNHGIDFAFVDGPLVVENGTEIETITATSDDEEDLRNHPLRVWWEEGTISSKTLEGNVKINENNNHGREFSPLVSCVGDADEDNDDDQGDFLRSSNANKKKEKNATQHHYVGLDVSLLLLRQIWNSSPFWGILAVGQAASVAVLLPLLPSKITTSDTRHQQQRQLPAFMIFVDGSTLLDEDESLTSHLDLPCLHVLGTDPTDSTQRLVHQFPGEVVMSGLDKDDDRGSSLRSSAAFNNHVGRFLVARKRDLKRNPGDVAVLALQHELHRTETDAAHLVARHIAENPPDALMAVITPKDVGGFRDRRRGPNEDGGGAPCPSEFLLHRAKRNTTTKPTTVESKANGSNEADEEGKEEMASQPSRHHPNQKRKDCKEED